MSLAQRGESIPPPDRIEAEIRALKKERNAVLLAHYYQESSIQDLADSVGDSLQLAQAARTTTADVICFAGVHFMAETAKILNPDRIVVVPDLEAGCSLADGCPSPAFEAWVRAHPGHTVVSYINCSAAVKARSDIICTSSNAVRVVASFPRSQPLLFAPDRHLGRWVQKQTGREDMLLWPGTCIVHETFSLKRILAMRLDHPEAEVVAHPECDEAVLSQAGFIGSTAALLDHVRQSPSPAFIVATEPGILHRMRREAPGKLLLAAPGMDEACACNVCPHMRRNTLEKLYLCLRDLAPRIDMDDDLRRRALRPIDRMLSL